jgi:Ser/Thr protein kinase RdoA (MazF antagonist)
LSVYSRLGFVDYVLMSTVSLALEAISTDPPAVAMTVVAEAVGRQFGLLGRFEPLVSERDQNFRLHADDGREYVIKVVSSAEDAEVTAFQIAMLRHLQHADDVSVPRVVQTLGGGSSGEIRLGDTHYRLRAVTWVDGEPLEAGHLDQAGARQFGTALARLDLALQGFAHPGEDRALAWDMQRVVELRGLVDNIDDRAVHAAVAGAIDSYESRVLPVKAKLHSQVIHGDANPGNVLVAGDRNAFIDFGDAVKAPRVFDLAIAAAYLRVPGDDPSVLIAPLVTGYQAVSPLEDLETDLLFDLIRARLATTITLLYWRVSARDPLDPYRQKTLELENGASVFLRKLDAFGRERFHQKLSDSQ